MVIRVDPENTTYPILQIDGSQREIPISTSILKPADNSGGEISKQIPTLSRMPQGAAKTLELG